MAWRVDCLARKRFVRGCCGPCPRGAVPRPVFTIVAHTSAFRDRVDGWATIMSGGIGKLTITLQPSQRASPKGRVEKYCESGDAKVEKLFTIVRQPSTGVVKLDA